MKRVVKYLAITLCVATNIAAVNDTQKTTLVLRDHRYRAAAFTTFHELKTKSETDFGSKFQMTGFYNETTGSSKLGEVFGANCKNCITVDTKANVDAGTADVENSFLLHAVDDLGDVIANTLKGSISFNPKRTTYGTHVEAYITLDKLLKGLYFKENIVLMKVKNDLGAKIYDEKTGAVEFESHNLSDILRGKRLRRQITDSDVQVEDGDLFNYNEPLCHAKIPCGSLSRTGLSNIESILGWNFIKNKDFYIGVNMAVHSPSGDRPTAEFLWEPRLGSQHWSLGGGLEAGITVWKDQKQSVKIKCNANYRFQFEETEKRTLGIKGIITNPKRCKHLLSHYYLLGQQNHHILFPAANVLTQDVEVKPGSLFDGLLLVNYHRGPWTIDAGYNFFWREEETVCLERCKWTDDTYAIASLDYQANLGNNTAPFNIKKTTTLTNSNSYPSETPINYCNIDTSVAQTPELISHTVFGGIGYIATVWEKPLMLGFGGAYEFGDGRASADSWTLWGKLGIAF